MIAVIGSQLRRDCGGQLRRGLRSALASSGNQRQQCRQLSTSTALRAAAAGGNSGNSGPEERREHEMQYMTSEHSTASAWDTAQPKLGTWPNIEPGVGRPDVVQPPEPSVFVKIRKLQLSFLPVLQRVARAPRPLIKPYLSQFS
ncbi:hypothetical protein VOLCADRAFT_98304 [Volvox carteri f. nagariensis]|uniref:Uncharacterized protein n=1 Tax=Volvox carteri f. nagariensis TaxID=3068 RepID=D8UEV6_VOLCA|nr:uncharacterized protein VOLCADRAFT_98304 [Volvox carteri f. nagariensis]EFJ41708.1 hypothetical protein VOLCADRAFT_98304 [Volvox carteri f. nagariensis]|eukprot:XP_002957210.1 hypothetical protein VOLCADRAFT_98304 [Volvox carteri f. nagariensis]